MPNDCTAINPRWLYANAMKKHEGNKGSFGKFFPRALQKWDKLEWRFKSSWFDRAAELSKTPLGKYFLGLDLSIKNHYDKNKIKILLRLREEACDDLTERCENLWPEL